MGLYTGGFMFGWAFIWNGLSVINMVSLSTRFPVNSNALFNTTNFFLHYNLVRCLLLLMLCLGNLIIYMLFT